MVLCSKENMVFWEKVEEAAQYNVHLLIECKIAPPFGDPYREGEYHPKQRIPAFLESKHTNKVIGDSVYQEINVVSVSREKTYYTFTDLVPIHFIKHIDGGYNVRSDSGMNYYAYVAAEDRFGNEINRSEFVLIKIGD